MDVETSPQYLALLRLLRLSDAVWNVSRQFFQAWDLSAAQFNVLNLLHDAPNGLSQTELSRELLTHRSNLTGLVDRLEKRGLVARLAGSDRRSWRVVLTSDGTALMTHILPRYVEAVHAVTAGLSERQTRAFAEILGRLEGNLAAFDADRFSHSPAGEGEDEE